MIIEFNEKGWFGICPVYFANLNSGTPSILERHWTFIPLMTISEWIYAIIFNVILFFKPNYDLAWPLFVTGEVTPPIQMETDVDF